jgi:hypothetical protein
MMRPESPRADGGAMSFREACGALGRRATRLKSADAALAASDTSMKKCLTAADLILLGVGGVIGGGVFVLTGAAAHDHAGPAVVVSYVLASLTSMITGLCYTEFAVETPVAGSAYNFVSMAFGEFAGYLCGCNLALELTIAAAAVARGWTSYVATLFHASPDALRIRIGRGVHDEERGSSSSFVELDFAAAALVALVTALLAYGMKETARFNTSVTAISLLVIFFVITFGGARVEKENWTPFAPGGVEGVLAGASVVFFSFVGFDTVATCAEETRDPGRDLPIGILGLARHLRRPVRGDGPGDHRHGPRRRHRRAGALRRRVPRLRHAVGGESHLVRRRRRHHHRAALLADGAAARVHGHGQGRAAAELVREGAPEPGDAGQRVRVHRRLRRRAGADGGHRDARAAGVHRHAGHLRRRLRRAAGSAAHARTQRRRRRSSNGGPETGAQARRRA